MLPVGITLMFSDNEDHSNHAGGTWERTSVGRVPVGIDTEQTEFDVIGETGGAKTHNHRQGGLAKSTSGTSGGEMKGPWNAVGFGVSSTSVRFANHGVITVTGVGSSADVYPYLTESSSSLQPYQVFAFWKRTA